MNKYIAIGIGAVVILITGFVLLSNSTKEKDSPSLQEQNLERDNQSSPTSQVVNKQASFAIFTNGIFRVFSASMYHNLSENVYIQADNPNVIHVKKKGITWNDFFETLPFTLTKDCLTTGTKETFCTGANSSLRFYLNGDQDQNALDKEVSAEDQLLVTFGNENVQQIQKQIQKLKNMIN